MLSDIYKVFRAIAVRKIRFEIDQVPLEFENLPYNKIVNWVLTELSTRMKPSRAWGFPTVLQIEPSSFCNLKCPFCPVTTGLARASGHMDLKMFQKIMEEVGPYLYLLLFWDWGEPFLNPDAYEMIRCAHRQGIKIMSSTNGHIFAKGDHARKVAQSGLDVLIFSVDGITPETYRRYRSQGKLEIVLEGIERVVAEKKRLNSKTPRINFRFIAMKHNQHEIGQLEDFARALGVDGFTLRKYHAAHSGRQDGTGQERDFSPTQSKYLLPHRSEKDGKPVPTSRNPCKNLWNCPTIHWNGAVCACFMDSSEKQPLGYLDRQKLTQIWYGEAYTTLRRQFKSGWRQLPLCKTCTYGYTGGDIGQQSNVQTHWF